MKILSRITNNPQVMGGKPCIRGLRVTVGTIVGLVASGYSNQQILELNPYLEPEDIQAALSSDVRKCLMQTYPSSSNHLMLKTL